MNNQINISGDHLETLCERGGYYECPKDSQGSRLGPLVGYTDTYLSSDGKKAWVGEVYVNFAVLEWCPSVLPCFALSMQERLASLISEIDFFCGVPGGYGFSQELALIFKRKAIEVEKDGQSRLVFRDHSVKEGKHYVIVKDICSNLFRTEGLISSVMSAGGIVRAIVCLLNKSMYFEDSYPSTAAGEVPVISLIRKPILQYRQDNPEVVDDIRNGNIVWDPEACWPQLMGIMQRSGH